MIAQILPLKRLPRHLVFFDYKVPSDMQQSIRNGQMVRIPFRGNIIFGLIFNLTQSKSEDNSRLLEIESIVHEEPFYATVFMNFFVDVGMFYGVSPATIAKLATLPLQKRKLQNIQLSKLPDSTESQDYETHYTSYTNENEHSAFLRDICKGRTVIFVPEIALIEKIQRLLGTQFESRMVTWHSKLTPKVQFDRWLAVRNQEKNIIITTKAGVFLPFQNIENIVVDYEHEHNHKQWDQQPRFHVKDIAEYLANVYKAKLCLASFSMSVESYYNIQKGNYSLGGSKLKDKELLFKKSLDTPVIIEPTREIGTKQFSAITPALQEKILQMADQKKDIFIFVNKKGHAPSTSKETQYGIGTQTIESELRALENLDLNNYQINRIEKEHAPVLDDNKSSIIIGTIAAFSHVRWNKTGLIIFLDIDRQLSLGELYSAEEIWHAIQYMLYHKDGETIFLIQSKLNTHFLLRSLAEPDRFYRTELQHRRLVHYPPYSYIVRYITASSQIEDVKPYYDKIKNTLTQLTKKAIISNLFSLELTDYKGQTNLAFTIKIPPDSVRTIKELNKHVPNGWKIDPNPITLLGI